MRGNDTAARSDEDEPSTFDARPIRILALIHRHRHLNGARPHTGLLTSLLGRESVEPPGTLPEQCQVVLVMLD
jgi:hypothetical protein